MTVTREQEAFNQQLCKVRQARLYEDTPVSDDILEQLLQIARWSGSGRNRQPWNFIVIRDTETLKQISELRPSINWVAEVPLAIALVMDGDEGRDIAEAYDEGRVTERLLIGAHMMGLGGGTAWYGDENNVAKAKTLLDIPTEKVARSVVAIGYPRQYRDHRPNPATPGRKPLEEIVGYEKFGRDQS